MKRLLCINTGGPGNLHGLRMRRLMAGFPAEATFYDVDRDVSTWQAARHLWKVLREDGPWDLIYQEGTGISAGACLIYAKGRWGQRFIVSSGDPIGGFFAVTKGPLAGFLMGLYERLLYRACTAFVGWTPYLTGAALQLGARRALTVEGAVDLQLFVPKSPEERSALRMRYGLPVDALVCGVVGSLVWTARQSYCYGLELVEMLKRSKRSDLYVLIVGDGDARPRLEAAIPAELRSRVVFTGRLAEAEVVDAMNVMDIGFVTQTLDALGNYRLTTKLPEYLACGVPVAMSAAPGFYDYAAPAGWALPPFHPASPEFHEGCAKWVDKLERNDVAQKAVSARLLAAARFDYSLLTPRFAQFLGELLEETKPITAKRFAPREIPLSRSDDLPAGTSAVGQRPLRLLTIGHSYVLSVNRAIVRAIAQEEGFEVTVGAPSYFHGDLRKLNLEPKPPGSMIKLVALDTFGSRFVHLFRYDGRKLRRLLEEGEFDVVHVWEEPYIYAGYQIARAVKRHTRARLVFRTAQNMQKDYLPPFNFFERETLRRADGWIAGGQLVYDAMVARGYDAKSGRVLSLAVDTELFQPLSEAGKGQARAELGLAEDLRLIGFVGRLTAAKGVRVLLRAVEALPAEVRWGLLFLGSGPEEAYIMRWASAHGWSERVRVRLARHDEVPRFLGAVDVLAAPSQTTPGWKEQFGRMIIEAFACGVPVIGSASGEIPNVVGDAGLIVPEADVPAWTEALATVLSNSEMRRELATKGMERTTRFSAKALAPRYCAFYREIAGFVKQSLT